MEEIRRNGTAVRRALMVALVLAVVISPLFYHFVSFLILPILVPLGAIAAFVFFTGLTDFERRKMIFFNIAASLVFIVVYQGYLFLHVIPQSHPDFHLNLTVWLVQVLTVNFLFILYESIRSLRAWKEADQY